MNNTSLYEMGQQLRHALDQRDALFRLLVRLGHYQDAERTIDELEAERADRETE